MKSRNRIKHVLVNKTYLLLVAGLVLAAILAKVFDDKIFLALWPLKNHLVTKTMIYATLLGEKWVVFLAVLFILFIGKKREYILPSILALLTSLAAAYVLKHLFAVPRPFLHFGINPLVAASGYSFPSGHSTAVSSVVLPLSRAFPKLSYLFVAVVIAVMFSRVYLGVHYLSDVLAGAALGLSAGTIFLRIGKNYWKKIRILQ